MSRALQAKLLRFLEDGTFTRVGGVAEERVDARLLAATNRNLIEAIQEGQFREDLYHRLNVVQFRVPPLRERGDDTLLLADHFLALFRTRLNKVIRSISQPARSRLRSHHWPGNVRELRNVMERAVILETNDEVQAGSLPDFELETGLRKAGPVWVPGQSLEEVLRQFERELLIQALEQNHYNLAKTADQLKITRHALRYRINRLELEELPGLTGEDASGMARKQSET
jgi:transcriptional regulator with PAS, ATPase and Fis domain